MRSNALARAILARVWFVHTPLFLLLAVTPSACVEMMRLAAKPSMQRLQFRNLFEQGRRYFIEGKGDGFRLMTTSKVAFRYRRRTAACAILRGRFSDYGDLTRVDVSVRINAGYLLSSLFIPSFMASLLIFMPWSPLLIGGLIAMLYTLSWFGHRYNARMEANEMVWFMQQSLAGVIVTDIKTLPDQSVEILSVSDDFEAEWDRFMDHLRDD